MRWTTQLPVLVLAIFVVSGCEEPPQQTTKTVMIKMADYGGEWPLLVDKAVLGCEPPSKAFVEIDGRRCALNGKALSAGLERCDDISKTGNAAALSVFIEKTLALCPGRE